LIARTKLRDWSLAGGLFRSIYAVSRDRTTLWLDVDEGGTGTETVYAASASRYASTSGEVRVSRTFTEGPRLHRFHASVRARDQARLYGEAGSGRAVPPRHHDPCSSRRTGLRLRGAHA
jgi:iron complex outermembrane receptor protein